MAHRALIPDLKEKFAYAVSVAPWLRHRSRKPPGDIASEIESEYGIERRYLYKSVSDAKRDALNDECEKAVCSFLRFPSDLPGWRERAPDGALVSDGKTETFRENLDNHYKSLQPGTPGSETDTPSRSSELTKSVYADFAIVRRQSDVRLDARLASVEIHDGQPSPDEPPEIWLYVDLGTVKTDGCRLGFRNWIVSIQFSDTRMSAPDETRFLGVERVVFRDGARIETSGGPNTPQWSFETTSRTEPLGASFRPAHPDGELRPLFHLLGGRKGQWVRAILRCSPKDIVVMDEEPEGADAERVSRAESRLIAHLNKMERFEGLFEEEHGIIATNQLDLVENDAEYGK